MTLVCDTSVLYASLDSMDRHHHQCAELVGAADALIVPSPTLVEIDQLARSRGVPGATAALLDGLMEGSFLLSSPDLEDYVRIRALVTEYADLPLGFVDASVVTTAERLGATTIATLDRRDFSVVRPQHVEAFALVP